MALREILASFGFQIDDSGLKKANVGIDNVVSKLTNLKGVLAGALGALGLGVIKGQIDELASESGELNKAAIKAGVGFEQFQKLQYQTGLGTEQLSTLFRKLQQNMAAAGGAAGEAASDFADVDGGLGGLLNKKQAGETFTKLGIQLKDAGGQARSSAEVFQDTAKAIAGLPSPAEKTAVAIRLFGRSGADLLPFLQKSPEAIQALGEQFDAIGGFSEENRKALAAYGKEQKALDLASKSLKITILTAIVPAFTWLFQKINEGVQWFKKTVDTSQLVNSALVLLTAGVVAFGVASASATASAVAGWLAVAAPIAAVYLILDDLIHFIKGDAHTATEDLIHLIFGKQEGDSWIKSVRNDVHALIEDLTGAKDLLKEIKEFAGFVASGGVLKAEQGILGAEDVQVANRGVTRKARRRGAAAAAEGGLGEGTREDLYGPTLEQGGKSLYQKAQLPGITLAPVTIPGTGKPAAPAGPVNVTNTTTINQTISGADAQDAADQSVSGIRGATEKDRRATLAAVEARK
jgi:hypothetical protein